jgi:hypothetical protein
MSFIYGKNELIQFFKMPDTKHNSSMKKICFKACQPPFSEKFEEKG